MRPSNLLRTVLLSCAALLGAGGCSPASAGLVDVALVDRDGDQWLPEYRARGETWVPGVPGHRYAVRLTNTTGERVLVVLSVDGVNAVSGEDADPAQAGYVLAPWQSTEVAGWRKSLDDVAQFYFTDLPDSYAARTGRPDNVGVVGVAVFQERRAIRYPTPPPVYRPWDDRETASSASAERSKAAPASPSAAAADGVAAQRIGTGHGDREWSPVGQTGFERASSRPIQLTQLRYDAPDRLAALGIVPAPYSSRWPRSQPSPRAFPQGFVPDPGTRD